MWWQSIQDMKDPDKPETWLFQNLLSWVGEPRPENFPDQQSRPKFWQDTAKEFAEPWKSVGASISPALNRTTDRTTYWKPTNWSQADMNGIVTLAGDGEILSFFSPFSRSFPHRDF